MRKFRMPQQPEPTSPSIAVSPAPVPRQAQLFPPIAESAQVSAPVIAAKSSVRAPQRIPRWLERSEMFLRVLLQMYIGLAVSCAPWLRIFWDQNPLFVQFPTLSIFAANGAVRGIVSGLGLLNLWIAFRSVLQRRDQ